MTDDGERRSRPSTLMSPLFLPLVLACVACRGEAPAPAGPALVAIDSVLLQENDTIYLARPGGLAIGADGRIFVSDMIANRVVRFAPDGAVELTYGAAGGGPGEFRSIGETVLEWNDTIALPDYKLRRLSLFRRSTGEYLGERRFLGKLTAGSIAPETIWLGLLDRDSQRAVARWRPSEGVTGAQAPAPHDVLKPDMVPIPDEYLRVPALNGIYGLVQIAAWRDSALVGFGGSDYLLTVAGNGLVTDTAVVPAIRRRGIPQDFLRRLESSDVTFSDKFRAASSLVGLWRRSAGDFVAVHYDAEFDRRLITARVFISMLSADRRRACVDAEVPVEQNAIPWVAVRGDTLFVLNQLLTGDEESAAVRTVIRKYRIDTEGCSWIPTQRTT